MDRNNEKHTACIKLSMEMTLGVVVFTFKTFCWYLARWHTLYIFRQSMCMGALETHKRVSLTNKFIIKTYIKIIRINIQITKLGCIATHVTLN